MSTEKFSSAETLKDWAIASWQWVEKNVVLLALLVGCGALAGIGVVVYGSLQRSKEVQAQVDFYRVDAKYTKIKQGFEKADMAGLAPKNEKEKKEQKPNEIKRSGDLAKDYSDIPSQYEEVIKKHPGSTAAAQAAIVAIDLYSEYKNFDRAIEIGQLARKKQPPHPLLRGLVNMGLGNALGSKGDCNAAISIWQEVLASAELKGISPEASLRIGLCHEKLGNLDLAKESYQAASAGNPGSPAAETAKSLLRAIEFKKSHAKKGS